MSGDTDNPRIWLGADVYSAPEGTTAPTNLSADWAAGWEALGLLSQDGLTESRSESQTDHWAWGNTLVRSTRRQHKRTFQVTALEDNLTVFELANPGSTSDTTGGVTTRTVVAPGKDIRAFGMEFIDGDVMKRRVIPKGEVTAVGDVVYSDNAIAMTPLTITAYPYDFDDDGRPILFYDITDDPAADESFS